MFGEVSIWTWMGAAIVFAIGGATGFFISRQLKDKRTKELEEKLAATRTELSDYRGEVNQHFLKTSLLVGKLTNDYREVYEHLATGAQKLCKEKPGTPKLDLPDTKILPTSEALDSHSDALETGSETAIEATAESTNGTVIVETIDSTATTTDDSSPVEAAEQRSGDETEKPSPEEIAGLDETDEDVPLGAESAPSVDTELHKTHPSVH